MLNVTIKTNDDKTVEHIIKYDTESYKDHFVNNKQKIYDAMVETAEKLGCLDNESNFKSLEFKTTSEDFATIIYNNSKQLRVYFSSDCSGALCIHGTNLRVTSIALVMAFSLGDIVKDVE